MPESPADKAMFADSKTRLPLNGITVLDLTLARAGPTAVRHFADWGANVIRIEPPASDGEDVAGRRHGFDFQNLHRNKRAITLNLKTPEGHAAFMKLVKTADVVLENMRANVKHRLKVSYDDVKVVNPRIVYGSISGFGQDGPYGPRAGVDQIAQGMGGLMTITGEPGRGPMRVGIPIDDLTAGNLLALGCMMAIYDRERTGVGRWVTTSLLEAQIFMLDFQASRWLMEKEVAGQAGNDHPTGIPTGVFPTSDGHINIAASSSRVFTRFCEAIERKDWLEREDWRTQVGRSKDRKAINEAIAEITKTKPSNHWIELFEANGIPVYRYLNGFLHQKCVLVDDDLVLIGSTNLDNRSLHLNFELMLAIGERKLVAEVAEMLEQDFAVAEFTSEKEGRLLPWYIRVGTVIARLFSPIL